MPTSLSTRSHDGAVDSRPRRAGVLLLAVAGMLLAGPNPVFAGIGNNSAESSFVRAETLYRQLDAVDPLAYETEAWTALADAYLDISNSFPGSPLAALALWRVGDIHERRQLGGVDDAWVQAAASYRSLVDRYPAAEQAPAALLRLGRLVQDGPQGQSEAAAHYYTLLERYPDVPKTAEARRRLLVINDNQALLASAEPAASTPQPRRASDRPLAPEVSMDDGGTGSRANAESRESEIELPAIRDGGGIDRRDNAVLSLRHYSDDIHSRVVIDLERPLRHEVGEVKDPARLFIDLHGADLPADLPRAMTVGGVALSQVRVGVNRPGVVRVVLDLAAEARYSVFTLAGPDRLVIDVASPEMSARLASARRPSAEVEDVEARPLQLDVRRIVIDPGHGGTAPGAIGHTGVTEKELALDIANRVAENLRNGGSYQVELTRDDDSSVELEDRPLLANQVEADLFVSIHINASDNRKLSGFETYYLDGTAGDTTAAETAARENQTASGRTSSLMAMVDSIVRNALRHDSRALAHSIQDSLVMQMSRHYGDVRDLGVKHAPFVVLVGARMPSVLIEASFISNEQEEQRLRTDAYRQRVADAIYVGIESFVEQRRLTAAF